MLQLLDLNKKMNASKTKSMFTGEKTLLTNQGWLLPAVETATWHKLNIKEQ